MYKFNVRVYGILINEASEILLSDEYDFNFPHTKFPGGGLELGEGTRDCLMREFMEECNLKVEVLEHIYTTDFYQKSAFNDSQIISIYYRVRSLEQYSFPTSSKVFDFKDESNGQQSLRWMHLNDFSPESMTLPIDKVVADIILEKYRF
jgi:8-oxo-dGTP diphosphatase